MPASLQNRLFKKHFFCSTKCRVTLFGFTSCKVFKQRNFASNLRCNALCDVTYEFLLKKVYCSGTNNRAVLQRLTAQYSLELSNLKAVTNTANNKQAFPVISKLI